MRFHLIGLPHTQTTYAYAECAYTSKVVKFCKMMMYRGYEVYLYSSEDNEAPCTEHVSCIAKSEQPSYEQGMKFEEKDWRVFLENVINEMRLRVQEKDFLCLISGIRQKPIADAFPGNMSVEFGVGYGGVFSKYRVFESYAWMHMIYANLYGLHSARGQFYDAVIPNYFDVSQFTVPQVRDDYYLFMGRLNEDKGIGIAAEVCKKIGAKLVVAGRGTPPEGVDYRGIVDPEERNRLMGHAIAVFAPTFYLEPFGGVAVEAQLCGTPVITTDWGAFTETVEQGVSGFRCRTFKEFVEATEKVKSLDPVKIRERAVQKYSLETVGAQYEDYFSRLMTLWGEGWYQL